MTATQKRFIAGAVCPRCAQLDKIVIYREQETSWRECVQCGYRDKMQEQPLPELPTRVSGSQPRVSADTQALKFYPSPKKH